MSFDDFAVTAAPRLRRALVAAYGLDVGVEAAAEAMAYGFEHWERLAGIDNPMGYLYRVGQTAARRERLRPISLPRPEPTQLPDVEPALIPALEQLTEQQRLVVLLVTGMQWRQSEVAELLDVSHSTIRTHLGRALTQLRTAIEGAPHA